MDVQPFFDDVAIAVLAGEAIQATAVAYGLSVGQVKAVVKNYCLRANPAAIRAVMPSRFLGDVSISVLRKHRDFFLPSRPASAVITGSSSIWCIPGIPTSTLRGLYEAGIDTIDEFVVVPVQSLSKLPRVGPEGLCRVLTALRTRGFLE